MTWCQATPALVPATRPATLVNIYPPVPAGSKLWMYRLSYTFVARLSYPLSFSPLNIPYAFPVE